jgi:hypothetical protein
MPDKSRAEFQQLREIRSCRISSTSSCTEGRCLPRIDQMRYIRSVHTPICLVSLPFSLPPLPHAFLKSKVQKTDAKAFSCQTNCMKLVAPDFRRVQANCPVCSRALVLWKEPSIATSIRSPRVKGRAKIVSAVLITSF